MSLKPGQRRAAIVLEWDWVQGHGITHMELHERDVIVQGSYTYGNAHQITEFPIETLVDFLQDLMGGQRI